jgi:hypothetical protein
MRSLVLELQKSALESKTSVAELLRSALLVAGKLDVSEFQKWIEFELKGYSRIEDIPPYRKLRGEIIANHPMRGWNPVQTNALPLELLEKIETFFMNHPIGELETSLRDQPTTAEVVVNFQPDAERVLRGIMNYPAELGLRYPIARFRGIVDAVRTVVLEWSLKLEKDGILGNDMGFSTEEKAAGSSVTYQIQSYIGQVTNSQIQQNTRESIMNVDLKPLDLGAVGELLKAVGVLMAQSNLHERQLSELRADVGTIETQMRSSNPKETIIREALKSIRSVLEGALGSVLAAGVMTQISSLLK